MAPPNGRQSLTGLQFATLGTLTSVNALAGDRIVVEVAARMTATGTTPTWEVQLGGDGTDHANSNGDTTGTVGWLEFSADITFLVTVTGTGTGALGLTATAAGTVTPGGTTVSGTADAAPALAGTVTGRRASDWSATAQATTAGLQVGTAAAALGLTATAAGTVETIGQGQAAATLA